MAYSVADAEPPQSALVLHEDSKDDSFQASSRSIDLLIWHACHDVAKAVTLFGPGVVVLPLLGRVSGIEEEGCLEYSCHPKRVAKGGVLDRIDMEMKYGAWDPKRLIEELTGRKKALEKRLQRLSNEALQEEVHAMQDWREKATGRLKTLERRAAWSFLGVAGEGKASQEEIKKAFKKRALELHPDKGGDAERFRLLQEMRDLLVEPKRYELEGKKEKSEAGKKDKKPSESKGKDKEGEEDEEDSEFSDDSWDADEEFRKMFPKRKKRPRRSEDDGAEPENLQNQDFHRGKFEAARRKLHRQLADMWSRASQLSEEIARSQTASSGSDAVRQLRSFVELFNKKEVSKLQENDPKKAHRIFRRFLEQGSEVLCAAGAVDSATTMSVVAMQVNYPLLQVAPSDDLQDQCAALLQAIQDLPTVLGQRLDSVQAALLDDNFEEPFFIRLLVPDQQNETQEAPGVCEVELQLPPGSTLGDLRAAALQMCKGHGFGSALPRLFCRGIFLVGSNSTSLASLDLDLGVPLQCLPSNLALTKARAKGSSEAIVKTRPTASKTASERNVVADQVQSPAIQVDPKGSEENKENEEDAWFDDFFATKASDKVTQEPRVEEPHSRPPAEQRAPVDPARRATQERGKQAMADRLKAQKEAKNKQKAQAEAERRKPAQADKGNRQPAEEPRRPECSQALVPSREPDLTQDALQKVNLAWDESWQHPCAGARRSDGKAIFCGPCDSWITLGSPFDHRDFEIHCEKVGHYGWID